MTRRLVCIALIAALAACNAERAAPAGQETTPAADADASTPAVTSPPDALPEPGEAGDTPVAHAADGADEQARFDGYGDLAFGIAAADMAGAWGGELATLGKDDNPSCYFMTPTWVRVPAEFYFMLGDGMFARYGTDSPKYLAPGGGRVGMTKAEIGTRYAGIDEQPHHYTDGLYLRIKDPAGGRGVLLFETDGKGDDAKVTEWRVGVPPQVDYVEGCA